MKKILRSVLISVFFFWNVMFAIVAMSTAPLLFELFVDTIFGLAAWDLTLAVFMLAGLPIFSLVHVVRRWQHFKEGLRLAEFLFGVELPFMMILFARAFGMGELAGALGFLYAAILAAGTVTELRLIIGDRLPKHQIIDGLSHALLVLRAAVSVYVGLIVSSLVFLTVVPAIPASLSRMDGEGLIIFMLTSPMWLWLISFWVLLLLMPAATPLAWVRTAIDNGKELKRRWGMDDLLVTSAGPIVAGVVITVSLWPQPHTDALKKLEHRPTTDDERRALVAEQDQLAEGLLDAYLGNKRYVFDDHHRPWLEALSSHDLLNHETREHIDNTMRKVARPFLYERPEHELEEPSSEWRLRNMQLADRAKARSFYQEFFGRELERDHARAIRTALSARLDRGQRFAGFIDEGQARVRLEKQEIAVSTHVSGAYEMMIHDTWVNQTQEQQEVVLFFELPETAAVTGVWLGDTDDITRAFTHVVSPRGAAQQLYREEVRARRDPALLEQIGPRQYRLRVFPIPPRTRARNKDLFDHDADTPRMHVWLRYQTLLTAQSLPPFPQLRERRNSYWDRSTERTLRFQDQVIELKSKDAIDGAGWVQLGGEDIRMRTLPPPWVRGTVDGGCVTLTKADAPPLPSLRGKTVDLVVDRSLAVAAHTAQITEAHRTLVAQGATVRVLLGTSAFRNEPARVVTTNVEEAINAIVPFGAASPKQLLSQFAEADIGTSDLVIVLAATASYDVADDHALPEPRAGAWPPIVLVHINGALPAGYDDTTLDAIRRSGGAIVTDITDGLRRVGDDVYSDGYRIERSDAPCGPVNAIASRQHILLADRGGKADLSELDGLHKVAVEASIATPYSSLLVLVDDSQRERLKALEKQDDRFEREVEDEAKVLNKDTMPQVPQVSGVPEPEEWLLLFLCMGVVLWQMRHRVATMLTTVRARSL